VRLVVHAPSGDVVFALPVVCSLIVLWLCAIMPNKSLVRAREQSLSSEVFGVRARAR